MRNIWLDGIMGVVVGDALGCPVEFVPREELKEGPVDDMEGYGTFDLPPGSWTDDSSLTLALLDSIREKKDIILKDVMLRFACWLAKGEYTPFGYAFDVGRGTMDSIVRYLDGADVYTCGGTTERGNGNGSLMRIMPACLFCYSRGIDDKEAVKVVHEVSGLTHNHIRAKIACGLYYFCVAALLSDSGDLEERLQKGLDRGFSFYERDISIRVELAYYGRLRDLKGLAAKPETEIRSGGYVVETIEAVMWSLVTTASYRECVLKAVNLGDDTDTVAAIAGGLAGLYYGYDDISKEWLDVIKRREWIEGLCADM